MNHITLNTLRDFNSVINADLVFTGNVDEEIDANMWAITFDCSLAEYITIVELKKCIDAFLEKKREQAAECAIPIACYIWVDEQAFQLCLNIISGHTTKLPFGCKINLVEDINPILEKFLTSARVGVIPWEDIIFVDEFSDEDDGQDYTLDVYLDLM